MGATCTDVLRNPLGVVERVVVVAWRHVRGWGEGVGRRRLERGRPGLEGDVEDGRVGVDLARHVEGAVEAGRVAVEAPLRRVEAGGGRSRRVKERR
jgi:hypothetical protein